MPIAMSTNPRLNDWHGRHAWIVGASSGIGLATAEALAAAGARVAVSARQAAPLQAFAARHAGALALPLDVTRQDQLAAAGARLQADWPRLDLVMYCAGHYQAQVAAHYDLAEMLKHQDINYVGVLRLLDVVLPRLLAQGAGHLSLVASVAGWRGLPQAAAYGPTKAALISLAQSLYFDLAPRGVGISVISPGFVDTPLTAQNEFAMPALITPDQAAAEILAGWRRGRFEIHFPRRFSRTLKLLDLVGLCSDRLYFKAVARLTGHRAAASSASS
jgi:NAD(P)-dependent dehydrogenase (short-subunit alcohol dehydrogenase family)